MKLFSVVGLSRRGSCRKIYATAALRQPYSNENSASKALQTTKTMIIFAAATNP